MKTCVVIPAYNEARGIPWLIDQIRQQGMEAVIVDDGSTDDTSSAASRKGAMVLQNPVNKGKGASLIRGFTYALENNFDAVITMDGDGQHDPAEIPFFMRLAQYSDSGLIIGNRMYGKNGMPPLRFLTNRMMSWFISALAKQHIPDTQCGFRLIKKEVLQKLKLTTHNYETESEMILKSSRLGYRIDSVPIKSSYRSERSRINPIVDTMRFIQFITRELWTTRS